jgi:chromosome transmission fidelity protein 4
MLAFSWFYDANKYRRSLEFVYDSSAIWHPSGQYFFIATRTHEIVTISCPSFKYAPSPDTMYVDPAHPSTGAITALAVSPNGLYLASASLGEKGEVRIWSVDKKRVLWRCVIVYKCTSDRS